MVEKASIARRIDVRLRALHEQLEALPWYLKRFGPAAGPRNGADWDALEAEWRDGLDRFERLHGWFLAGELNAEQAEQHRQNLALLSASVPMLRQLNIALPRGEIARWLEENAPARTLAEPA